MKMNWKNSAQQWGAIAIIMHWTTAITIISLFALGLWMTGLTYYSEWYQTAPYIHKSVGILLLIVTVARLGWRVKEIIPSALPTHTKAEQTMGHLMHLALYGLIFGMIVSGYLISTADGRAISVFGWFEVPATITSLPQQEDIAGLVHLYMGYTIIAMASLHGLAAVKHHVIDKDNTLKRMLGKN
jgi:cytochrome b561